MRWNSIFCLYDTLVNLLGIQEVASLTWKDFLDEENELHWNPQPTNTSAASKQRRGYTTRDQVPCRGACYSVQGLWTPKKSKSTATFWTYRQGNRAQKENLWLAFTPCTTYDSLSCPVTSIPFNTLSPCVFWALGTLFAVALCGGSFSGGVSFVDLDQFHVFPQDKRVAG